MIDQLTGGWARGPGGAPCEGDLCLKGLPGDRQRVQVLLGVGDGGGNESEAETVGGQLGGHPGVCGFEGDVRHDSDGGAGVVELGAQAGAPGQADQGSRGEGR